MKKIALSLLLVMAMLLSIVPLAGATGATTSEPFTGNVQLYLDESIAVGFEVNYAAVKDNFGKVVITCGDQTSEYTQLPAAADANGHIYFRFSKLTPAQLGETITATIYDADNNVLDTSTPSVKKYCEYVINNKANYAPQLVTLCVNLLNYGAATQTYVGDTAPLVNADLTDEQKNLGTDGAMYLTSISRIVKYSDVTDPVVTWNTVGLQLKDRVALRYTFTATETENIVLKFVREHESDSSKNVSVYVASDKFVPVEGQENTYYVDCTLLNPAQLSASLYALAYRMDENSEVKVSHRVDFNAESYAYIVANDTTTTYANEKPLTQAMMHYGNATLAYRHTQCVNPQYSTTVPTFGLCKECGAERTYVMEGDSITLEAEEAVLNVRTNGTGAINVITNEKAQSKKLLTFSPRYTYSAPNWIYKAGEAIDTTMEGVALAKKHDPGNIVVYVTPAKSGKYSIQTVYGSKGAVALGYLIEDETTTDDTLYAYHRIATATDSVNADAMTKFSTHEFGNTYQWVAGKTYAIRMLATSSNGAFDQFTITHIHEYTDDTDATCNGCGEERCLHPHTVAFDDTHHWFDYSCDCGLPEEKVEHTYTKGVCECGKKRVFATSNGFAFFEAEDAILNGSNYTLVTNQQKASNTTYVQGTAKTLPTGGLTGESTGDIEFAVKPDVTGTYYIWARMQNKGANMPFGVWIQGSGGYKYQNHAAIEVTADPDTSYVWRLVLSNGDIEWEADQEYNVKLGFNNKYNNCFDQFVITTDANYEPSGIVTAAPAQ